MFPQKSLRISCISCLCNHTLHFSFKLDVDECSEDSDPCDENADCANSDGSYSCTCKQGFTGDGVSCSGMHALLHFVLFLQASSLQNKMNISRCKSMHLHKGPQVDLLNMFVTPSSWMECEVILSFLNGLEYVVIPICILFLEEGEVILVSCTEEY